MAAERIHRAAPVALAALLMLWPALLNGYPLVFADTGTYLSQAIDRSLGWDRPVFYSFFLLPLHMQLTTWPVIVAQALLTAWLLHLLRRCVLPSTSAWWLVPVVAFCASLSPVAVVRVATHARCVHRPAGDRIGAADRRHRGA